MGRIYLDYNATAPLRAEARAAMIAAMDAVGNPSSVHAEGRAAKAIVEKARAQVSSAFGADGADIIFTSGATEAAALACFKQTVRCDPNCHDALWSHNAAVEDTCTLAALSAAESETGLMGDLAASGAGTGAGLPTVLDAAQVFGKTSFAFNWTDAQMALVSAHKLGGPKGVGALVVKRGTDIPALISGGGQEMGRRSGTENVIAIAGFGAAAEAAQRDLESGAWRKVAELRTILELTLAERAKHTIFVGNNERRLPNTSCILTPGWKGETQVMQMDLAGFAISAGSACSSGKVKASRVLMAMGFDEIAAASAIRVSLGPENTEQEVLAFADAWLAQHEKFRARAA